MDKQKLEDLISTIDFSEPYNAKGHRAIYSSVCPSLVLLAFEHVDPPPHSDHLDSLSNSSPDDEPSAVPPCLLFYAARNILRPSFIVGQIPDLLNLLTSIETLRRFATLKSDEALEWQKYYEREKTHGREEDVRSLATDEVRALQRFVVQNDAQRREYIVLVRNLILLYIHYLWTAPESECLLAKRLNDLFPGSIQGVETPSELLFHVDLSSEEKTYFGRLKEECHEWMNVVVDWEKKREDIWQSNGKSGEEMEDRFADDFRHAFPEPSNPSEMVRNVEKYINKVEDIVRRLEQLFAPSCGK